MKPRRGPVVALTAGIVVAAGSGALLGAAPLTAGLLGVVYGCYAWTLWAYPLARRFHFRRQAGRNFWLGPALLAVTGAALSVPVSLALPFRATALLFLALLGSLLAVGTLAGLLAQTDGLIDHEWR